MSYLQRILRRLWSNDKVLLLKKAEGIEKICTMKNFDGELREVSYETVTDCLNFESEKYVQIYREMIAAGDLVIFGYKDNKCVFRCCVQLSGDIVYGGCKVRNLEAKREGNIHYVYCAPEYRGQGFHSACVNYCCEKYKDYALYTQVKEDNASSLIGFIRNGFEIKSILLVKNRFFHRAIVEKKLDKGECAAILKKNGIKEGGYVS